MSWTKEHAYVIELVEKLGLLPNMVTSVHIDPDNIVIVGFQHGPDEAKIIDPLTGAVALTAHKWPLRAYDGGEN